MPRFTPLTPSEERDLNAVIPHSSRWRIVSDRIIKAVTNGGREVFAGISGFFSDKKQGFDVKMYEMTIRSIDNRLESIYNMMHDDFEKFAGDWEEVKPNYLEFVRSNLQEIQTLFSDFYHCLGREYKQYRSYSHYVRFLIDVFCSSQEAGTDLFDTASYSEPEIEEYYITTCQPDLEKRTEGSYEPGSFARKQKSKDRSSNSRSPVRRSRSRSQRRSRSRSQRRSRSRSPRSPRRSRSRSPRRSRSRSQRRSRSRR